MASDRKPSPIDRVLDGFLAEEPRFTPALFGEPAPRPLPDLPLAEDAFGAFLVALGYDPEADPHLAGTPARVAKMYADLLGGKPFAFTTFPAEGSQMIVVRAIPFVSFCAHHFLPFTGHAHVGYIADAKIAGLSKLARAVEHLAAAPQVQERLTEQVADFLVAHLTPRGVGVKIEARHECMELRGVRAVGAVTVTSALRGIVKDDPAARAEFLDLVRG